MKKLQQLFGAILLTLLLSMSVFAGDGIITTMKTDPPPPPSSVMATNNGGEAEGIIHTGRVTSVDPLTDVVLNLLPSVLALF
jgi:hypothetical protein